MKLIFAYTRDLRGPAPVVFHDGIPTRDGKATPVIASWDITDRPEFYAPDHTPYFGRLMDAFPCPAT